MRPKRSLRVSRWHRDKKCEGRIELVVPPPDDPTGQRSDCRCFRSDERNSAHDRVAHPAQKKK